VSPDRQGVRSIRTLVKWKLLSRGVLRCQDEARSHGCRVHPGPRVVRGKHCHVRTPRAGARRSATPAAAATRPGSRTVIVERSKKPAGNHRLGRIVSTAASAKAARQQPIIESILSSWREEPEEGAQTSIRLDHVTSGCTGGSAVAGARLSICFVSEAGRVWVLA